MADADPGMSRLAASFMVMAVMLTLTVLAMGAVNRFLERDDPRRPLFTQAILYASTGLLIVILLLLR